MTTKNKLFNCLFKFLYLCDYLINIFLSFPYISVESTQYRFYFHYRGKHKLSNEEMPPITRKIPFTIEAYTKSQKGSKSMDENNNSIKMESDSSSSSFDQDMMYSPASQSASSTYSPASYSVTSAYSPASQSVTPTYPQSPVPTSVYTPGSQPATPTFQHSQTPTSFAELFFNTPSFKEALDIKQEEKPAPSPTYNAQRSPEEGLVPQQMHIEEQPQPTSVMHPEMMLTIKPETIPQEAAIPQNEILPIFTLPLSQIPEVTNQHQQETPLNLPASLPSQTTKASTPLSSKTTSLPPPPPYSQAHSPVDTSYNVALTTTAHSFLEQLGEVASAPPSYYEALSNVYPQYSSSSNVPTNELQSGYTRVSPSYYDNQVVPTSIQRDVQFVDL